MCFYYLLAALHCEVLHYFRRSLIIYIFSPRVNLKKKLFMDLIYYKNSGTLMPYNLTVVLFELIKITY